MPKPRHEPDAREVDRIEVLATADPAAGTDAFLARCVPGSTWLVQIRTADVSGTLLARAPLGSFDERDFTCLSLRLDLPVPVEPGLRVRIIADDDRTVAASGLIRPWAD